MFNFKQASKEYELLSQECKNIESGMATIFPRFYSKDYDCFPGFSVDVRGSGSLEITCRAPIHFMTKESAIKLKDFLKEVYE
jgi:hypothetical protein